MPRQSRNISKAGHASTGAGQRAHQIFRAAASVLSSGRRPTTPEERVHNVVVGLAGASVEYLRGGWEEGVARSAVGAAAKASERRAQAEDAEREHVMRGSLGPANERTSALKRLGACESL